MNLVLLVDDNPQNLYLLRMLMQGNGYEVLEAANGVQALQAARQRVPDLVISDLLMPEMDGYTLLRHWKADDGLRSVPFIVYTATYTEPKDERLALDMGADAFIVKPSEPETLMARVLAVTQASRADGVPAREAMADDNVTLRLYNEVLVHKLETKSAQLEGRVAELLASEAQIKRLNRLYAALSETSQAIVYGTDRDALFSAICRIAVERGGFALAWVATPGVAAGTAEVPVASHGAPVQWFVDHAEELRRCGGHSPVDIALREGRQAFSRDVLREPALWPLHPEFARLKLGAVVAFPLRIGEHVVAALALYCGEDFPFDEQLQELVTEMASDVSFALAVFEKEDLRRAAEFELSQLNADLAQRIEARTAELSLANKDLQTFSYSVSHDLRAPLSTIHGFTSLLLQKNAETLDATSMSMLSKVLAGAERMSKLIDALLGLAGLSVQELQTRDVDLSQQALKVVDELRQAEPGRRVEVRIEPGLRAHADPQLVQILLENLIGNAWKYTGQSPHASIAVGMEAEGQQGVFFVRDNGAGFDMQQADKLFAPFQRLHSATHFPGSGIGLSIVERIVTRHHGRVWAEAETDKGATFRFTLQAQPA